VLWRRVATTIVRPRFSTGRTCRSCDRRLPPSTQFKMRTLDVMLTSSATHDFRSVLFYVCVHHRAVRSLRCRPTEITTDANQSSNTCGGSSCGSSWNHE
jgi:hypothetical protein